MYPYRVTFDRVYINHYSRVVGGSGGVPSEGGCSLGLDWSVEDTEEFPIDEYEANHRRKSLRSIAEIVRTSILVEFDEDFVNNAKEEKKFLLILRRSRTKNAKGCACKGECTWRCSCFQNGIPCNENTCGCSYDICKNDHQHVNREQINQWRERYV